ncbi:hypothetical protein ABVK25_007765 [Lepraria finkii]|uniref:Rhodopsin domain-containing protein n=1 Tax=Lepraria finkii TaxID=1340010 RepID=A0ABR4B287_9LECA
MNPYGLHSLLAMGIVMPLLSIAFVYLRFYVRLRVRRAYIGLDDWLILLSIFLVIGQSVIQILGVEYGVIGRTIPDDITPQRIKFQQRISHGLIVIEKSTYTLIKLSVLFLYRRIFGANRKFRVANDILIVVITLWGSIFLLVQCCFCSNKGLGTLSCDSSQWSLLWFAITEVLGDIAILSLPYPCIRKLQMGKRDKIGLIVIFSLGGISTFFGIVRLLYVAKTFHTYFNPHVVSRTGAAPEFWTTVEVCLGVVAACLPPLGPLLRKLPGPIRLYHSFASGLSAFRHELSSGSRSSEKSGSKRSGGWSDGSGGTGGGGGRRHGSDNSGGSRSTGDRKLLPKKPQKSESREPMTFNSVGWGKAMGWNDTIDDVIEKGYEPSSHLGPKNSDSDLEKGTPLCQDCEKDEKVVIGEGDKVYEGRKTAKGDGGNRVKPLPVQAQWWVPDDMKDGQGAIRQGK